MKLTLSRLLVGYFVLYIEVKILLDMLGFGWLTALNKTYKFSLSNALTESSSLVVPPLGSGQMYGHQKKRG